MMITRQIFIGGCSRSGTTLIGSMLGAHSDCITTPESHFKTGVLRGQSTNLSNIDLNWALRTITRHWRFKIWGIEIDSMQSLGETEKISSYSCLLEWLVEQYALQNGKPDAKIWVDHTPENISFADTLLKLFPHAKMIHIVRDGRGVASSIMPLDWGPNTIQNAAHWWIESVGFGLASEMYLGADRMMRIRYEDLVQGPEQVLQALCNFLVIDYQPKMLEECGFKVPKYTASQHTLIGQKPDADRAVRWKKQLSPRQVELFENIARDFLILLGYQPQYGISARKSSWLELGGEIVKEIWRKAFINNFKWLRRALRISFTLN